MNNLIRAGLVGLAATFAVEASAKTYTCQISQRSERSWVPRELIIEHDEATGAVSVWDTIIQRFYGEPIAGRLDVQNNKRVTFKWELDDFGAKGTDDLQFTTSFNFVATIRAGSNTVIVTAKPLGFRNSFRGSGSCTVK